MALDVYSTNFFRAPSASGGRTLAYTVPDGYRAIIKCITMVWGVIALSSFDAWLETAEGCKLVRTTWTPSTSAPFNYGGSTVFWGMWVLEPGEPLYWHVGEGTGDIQANGYLLLLP